MKFTIYTRNGCPYCTKIKQVLEGKGFTYKERRLDRDFTREQFYQRFGNGSTFPQVLVNEQSIGGCSDAVRYLRENNLL